MMIVDESVFGAEEAHDVIRNFMQVSTGSTWKEKVAFTATELAKFPQIEMPLIHRFAPGLYLREIFMPAGTIVIGKIHRTKHFNIVLRGRCILFGDGVPPEEIVGPCTFVSEAGVQKLLYIVEDTQWQTAHVTDDTDVARIEMGLVEPSPVDQIVQDRINRQKLGEIV